MGGVVTELVPAGSSGFWVLLSDGQRISTRRLLLATGLRDELPPSQALPNDGRGMSCTAPTAMATKSATSSWASWEAVHQRQSVTHKSPGNGERTSSSSYQPGS